MHDTLDYQSLFDLLPERYVVFDTSSPGFTMIAASNEYLKVTGKSRSEIIGNRLFEIFPDVSEKAQKDGKGELQTSLENVIRTLEPDSTGIIRYDIADANGTMQIRFWQATHYPVIKNNTCVSIVQSTADVTDLVTSNEELRLANLKLEDALSAGLIGSWSWDIKKDIVTADKGLAKLFGISPEKALKGLSIDVFVASIHESDREAVARQIQEAVVTGSAFESEYRTVDSEGKVRWVIARGHVERNGDGEAEQFPGVMIDISDRKEAEAALKHSEERLRFMADTMPQLVWITRPDGYHEYYNKHWYEYTGTKVGSTDGEGWNNLFHASDQARARKVWAHSLKTGEPYEIKYRLFHAKSNTYRWVIGRALPFKNENGEIVKWYGTCTDIDDSIKEIEARKKLEAALQDEKSRLEDRVAERTSQLRAFSIELERSNKELEEFAYVSSHDLQEPLRKIQAFGDLLVEEYGQQLGDGYEYLKRIQSSAHRMSALIDDLLAFSRVSTKPATYRPVDLNEVMRDVLYDLDERIKKEKGTVEVPNGLPVVHADETHMRQLFQNLISNGLKFHVLDVSPKVVVDGLVEDGKCIITVRDNGIGIDEKYQDKIFAVFQRLNTKAAYEGTGIGLAVCKKIVERYNGTIAIESQLGIGTTFTITLPIVNEV